MNIKKRIKKKIKKTFLYNINNLVVTDIMPIKSPDGCYYYNGSFKIIIKNVKKYNLHYVVFVRKNNDIELIKTHIIN